MPVVYVKEQGAVIRKANEVLYVMQKDKQLFAIPLADLDQLVLLGNIQLTTQSAVVLMRHRVDVIFMSQYGKYRGRLLTLESKFAKLRHQQLRLCDDEPRSLQVARNIVIGKIANQRVVLQRRAGENVALRQALIGMARMADQADSAGDLDQLRGYEGKAAAFYFGGLRSFFAPEWGFHERAYFPPPDPANALLSFTYTLLLKDVEAKIQLVGLDPYLGFFHALGYDRPGLALDIMEEFRPSIADIVVMNLVRTGQITPADFERTNLAELPVRMTQAAMENVVAAYEDRMADKVFHPLANGQTDYRRAIELQVRQMANVIQGDGSAYEALTIR
ncbi:MAG: CRISPR-associated endonuclease Cas1 [Chloroflexota bacterium]